MCVCLCVCACACVFSNVYVLRLYFSDYIFCGAKDASPAAPGHLPAVPNLRGAAPRRDGRRPSLTASAAAASIATTATATETTSASSHMAAATSGGARAQHSWILLHGSAASRPSVGIIHNPAPTAHSKRIGRVTTNSPSTFGFPCQRCLAVEQSNMGATQLKNLPKLSSVLVLYPRSGVRLKCGSLSKFEWQQG